MKAHHRIQATGDFGKDEVVQAINVALNKCEKVNKDNFIPTFRKIADWELKKIGGKIFVVRVSRILRNYEIELFSEVHLGENAYYVISHVILPQGFFGEVVAIKEV